MKYVVIISNNDGIYVEGSSASKKEAYEILRDAYNRIMECVSPEWKDKCYLNKEGFGICMNGVDMIHGIIYSEKDLFS